MTVKVRNLQSLPALRHLVYYVHCTGLTFIIAAIII